MATIEEQIVKELHQMNIYLKSIAESLSHYKNMTEDPIRRLESQIFYNSNTRYEPDHNGNYVKEI